jgi:ATP:ADP antiporter, AAA family
VSFSLPQSPQVRQAVFIAAVMMTWQVAAKTARDSLFLAVFPPESLLTVVGVSAVCSIALAYASSVVLRRVGPARVIPLGFLLSAAIHVAQWILLPVWQKPVTVFIYIYVVAFGPVLLSGFWALVNECFDSRQARRNFGQIAAFGTIGAVSGGLLAERVGILVNGPAILILLACLQVVAGMVLWQFASSATRSEEQESPSLPQVISNAPYLVGLSAFVLLAAMCTASLDYLYRAGAVAQFGRGPALVRFFSLFYAVTSGLTFLLQVGLAPLWMRRFGPGGTVAGLPFTVAASSAASVLIPGPMSVIVSRSLEQMARGSLYRSGYELFYTPMPAAEKRAAKPVIDIGVERAGEGLAAGGIKLLLLTLPSSKFAPVLLLSTSAVSAIAAWLAIRLDRSYVMVLERGLANQAIQLDLEDAQDALTRSVVMESTTAISLGTGMSKTTRMSRIEPVDDPILARLTGLRHPDPARVRTAIREPGKWEPVIVAQMIDLLARDEVARQANEALRAYLPSAVGQLVDRLADSGTDPKIRKRIPRLLASSKNPLAWDALFRQLGDHSAEIRYRCGRALAEIGERHPEFRPPADLIFRAVERELSDTEAKHRLSQLSNLIGLVLPPQSVHLAFRALQTDDAKLRATAIEYLESVLPQALRHKMAAQFDVQVAAKRSERATEQALTTLVDASPTILARLAQMGVDTQAPPPHDD